MKQSTPESSKIITIPNMLSAYRLLSFPVVIGFIAAGNRDVYFWLVCINLVTDFLDGFIARVFHQYSKIGAQLDSIADIANAALIFIGLFVFQAKFISVYGIWFFIVLGMYILKKTLAIVKFRKIPSYHLYSTKISVYCAGFFFFLLFTVGTIDFVVYLTLVIHFLAYIEDICITLILKQPQSDVKGIYWVMKSKGQYDTGR